MKKAIIISSLALISFVFFYFLYKRSKKKQESINKKIEEDYKKEITEAKEDILLNQGDETLIKEDEKELESIYEDSVLVSSEINTGSSVLDNAMSGVKRQCITTPCN